MTRWLGDLALERLRAAADTPDLEGTRYRVVGKLGQGGMAGVFRVVDAVLQREVALKVITVGDRGDDGSARLLQEAQVIARLEHPGIVPVHDAGLLADGRAYYTMQFVQGKRLDEHIVELPILVDRLRVFLRICEAVAFAHAHGVLHRDLKPGNIMVGPFGEVLVMDWGLAKWIGKSPRCCPAPARAVTWRPGESGPAPDTAHGTVFGTPGYRAPEQAQGLPTLDQRADIYSLGAILRFLLANASPRPPRQLAAIQGRALAADREHRYQTVDGP